MGRDIPRATPEPEGESPPGTRLRELFSRRESGGKLPHHHPPRRRRGTWGEAGRDIPRATPEPEGESPPGTKLREQAPNALTPYLCRFARNQVATGTGCPYAMGNLQVVPRLSHCPIVPSIRLIRLIRPIRPIRPIPSPAPEARHLGRTACPGYGAPPITQALQGRNISLNTTL